MNEQALKDRLRAIAQSKGKTFNEVWKLLLLERFLARLSLSRFRDSFVFKGGLLLAQRLNLARETTDVDLLLTKMDGSTEKMEAVFREICLVDGADGFDFKLHTVDGLTQPHMQYGGFRVDIEVHLGKMRDHVQVDVGIGDRVAPVTESFRRFEYKGQPIFGGEISVLTYPIETIFAEKLETIISKGVINSRMKDYHDVLLIDSDPEAPGYPKTSHRYQPDV